MNAISRFKALSFFLIAMFVLSACGGRFQRWVTSSDNSNHGDDHGPKHDNHDDQGASGGNNGSGGD